MEKQPWHMPLRMKREYLLLEVKDKPEFAKFRDIALLNSKRYTHIFYLPPEIPLDNDGFRHTSDDFRQEIDKQIFTLLQDFQFFTMFLGRS